MTGRYVLRIFLAAATVAVYLSLLAAPLTAAPLVDSSTLIEKGRIYDGRAVRFRGEVIGDVMIRGDHAWLNINDDAYSRQGPVLHLAGYNAGQGVILPADEARKVKQAGGYFWRGDYVEVAGVFRRSSSKHGGEMIIEGRSLRVVKKGFRLTHGSIETKLFIALILAAAAAITTLLSLRLRGKPIRLGQPRA